MSLPDVFDPSQIRWDGPMGQKQQEAEREAAHKDSAEARANATAAREGRSETRQEANTAHDNSVTDANQRLNNPQTLRKEFYALPEVKSYKVAAQQLAQALGTGKGPQADLALTYAFAKAMDPDSVVRESEQGMVTESQPWFTSKVEATKKQFGWDEAGGYSEKTRAALRQQIIRSVAARDKLYNQQRTQFTDLANRNGIDPIEVVGRHTGEVYRQQFRDYDQSRREAGANLEPLSGSPNAMRQDTVGPGAPGGLAGGGDDRKAIPIPPEMQQEYEQFVRQNRGKLDPDAFAAFRDALDQKYGFAPNPPAQIEKNREYAQALNDLVARGGNLNLRIPAADKEMTGIEKVNASLFNNPLGAAVLGAGSGWTDEVVGTGKALLSGGDADSNIASMDAMRQALAAKYPGATVAGQIGGGIVTGIAGGSMLNGPGTLGGTLATSAGYGAFSGAGEDNDNRTRGALLGAGAGAAGGLAGKYAIAPLAERVTRSAPAQNIADLAVKYLPGDKTRVRAPELSVPETAVYGMSPDFDRVRQNVADAADLGLPYALADADPKLRMLGGTVARKSINARELAETTFEPRARGQAERAIEAIDTHLAPITDIEQRGADLLKAADQAAAPSYNLAMDRAGPVDHQIDAMLQTPAGREALTRARTIAANDGKDATSLGFDLNDQGEVVLKTVPSFETLQLVKRGLDSHVEDFRDPLTKELNLRGNPMAQSVDDLRKRFVGRLGVINPDYAAGNAEWARYAQRKDALDLGHGVLPKTNIPARDFQTSLDRISQYDDNLPPELTGHATMPEAQRGYATSLADAVDGLRLSRDPYDAIYGSPQQQEKLTALFPEGAPQFDRQYNFERDMTKTRNEVLGGSPTAGRLQADEQIGGQVLEQGLPGCVQALL